MKYIRTDDGVYKLTIDRYEYKENVDILLGEDELKKYKDLLNEGIITQEEFEAKKKQILGI